MKPRAVAWVVGPGLISLATVCGTIKYVVDTLNFADDAGEAQEVARNTILWLTDTGPLGVYLSCAALLTVGVLLLWKLGREVPVARETPGQGGAPHVSGGGVAAALQPGPAVVAGDEPAPLTETPEQNRAKHLIMNFVRRHLIEAFQLQDNVILYYIHNYVHRAEPREVRPFMKDGFRMNFHLTQEVNLLAKASRPAEFFGTNLSDLEAMLVETKAVYNTRSQKLEFFTMMRNRGEFVVGQPDYVDGAIRAWHAEHERMSAMWSRVARDGSFERLFEEARRGVPWRKTSSN